MILIAKQYKWPKCDFLVSFEIQNIFFYIENFNNLQEIYLSKFSSFINKCTIQIKII
jgi:hypothetical protein